MPETTDIFEVMSTMRAMRRLKPDPVPDELINKILDWPEAQTAHARLYQSSRAHRTRL